jgi:Bax protein
MQLGLIRPAIERGRRYSFALTVGALLAAGIVALRPLPTLQDVAALAPVGPANAAVTETVLPLLQSDEPRTLSFVRHEVAEPDDGWQRLREGNAWAHGRFAAPGNAVRRQVQLRSITARTADELAGFFRQASYTLGDIRQGEAVPPLRLDKIPADLGNKDGNERKSLFITALLPVVLEVNQRVLADRQQLLYLRDKLALRPNTVTAIERLWLDELAQRYDGSVRDLDELVRRVVIVSGWLAFCDCVL